jgi:hypothetical protein
LEVRLNPIPGTRELDVACYFYYSGLLQIHSHQFQAASESLKLSLCAVGLNDDKFGHKALIFDVRVKQLLVKMILQGPRGFSAVREANEDNRFVVYMKLTRLLANNESADSYLSKNRTIFVEDGNLHLVMKCSAACKYWYTSSKLEHFSSIKLKKLREIYPELFVGDLLFDLKQMKKASVLDFTISIKNSMDVDGKNLDDLVFHLHEYKINKLRDAKVDYLLNLSVLLKKFHNQFQMSDKYLRSLNTKDAKDVPPK